MASQTAVHTNTMHGKYTAFPGLDRLLHHLLLTACCLVLCACTQPATDYAEPQPPRDFRAWQDYEPPLDPAVVYLRDLHVSPAGDDSTGDGSPAAPFLTLQRAAEEAIPGSRILLAAGLHSPFGTVAGLSGEPGLPVAITGEAGACIDGSGSEGIVSGIHLSAPRHVVIENIRIQNTFPHGLSIDDGGTNTSPAGPILLRGLVFSCIGRGLNNDCLKLSGVARFQVLGCEFSGCDRGEAIDMVGCHHGLIAGNTFRDMPGTGVQTKGGSSDITIHGNRFMNIASRSLNLGGHTGAPYFRPLDADHEAARIKVLSNIIHSSGDAAIAFVGCFDCLAAHNTIISPQGPVLRMLEENLKLAPGGKNRFLNNLISFHPKQIKGYVTAGPQVRTKSFTLGWNLWHIQGEGLFHGPRHGPGIPPERSSLFGVDPKFFDPGSGDYRIRADSPARSRGLVLPGTLPDYQGRAFGSPPDMGAVAAP